MIPFTCNIVKATLEKNLRNRTETLRLLSDLEWSDRDGEEKMSFAFQFDADKALPWLVQNYPHIFDIVENITPVAAPRTTRQETANQLSERLRATSVGLSSNSNVISNPDSLRGLSANNIVIDEIHEGGFARSNREPRIARLSEELREMRIESEEACDVAQREPLTETRDCVETRDCHHDF
jgi:hypothetical protein